MDHVTFTVRRGEVFGFLGPNGAGKTTVLEIIEVPATVECLLYYPIGLSVRI